ncbi:hypothetical protein G4228_011433 [Cervus hanglu yarkandensis]|nr:hypothetical protein G4228_011433 [Cervus hanglu yarkandensis]
MERGFCSKVLFCLSACRVLQTLKHSIDAAFHSSNLHLKKSQTNELLTMLIIRMEAHDTLYVHQLPSS